jgi:hypothetical protein
MEASIPSKRGMEINNGLFLTSLHEQSTSSSAFRMREEKKIRYHDLLLIANFLATPNIRALVKSPRSRVQARATAPPMTKNLGTLCPTGFSDVSRISISDESLMLVSKDLR